MPVSFTPDNVPRYDSGLLRYINENFQRLKSSLQGVAKETVGASAPADPYTGQGWLDTTNKQLKYWNGTAWKPLGNYEKVDYTPVLTQSVTVATTVNYANWERQGDYVVGEFLLSPTGSGTASNLIQVSLPVNPATSSGQTIGYGYIYNNSGGAPGFRIPFFGVALASVMRLVDAGRSSGAELVGETNSAFTEALVSGDSIHANFRYRVT